MQGAGGRPKPVHANKPPFVDGDAKAMPLDENSFDAVVSLNSLHVVDDPVAMIDECRRVLVPGGTMLISTVGRSWLRWFVPVFRTGYTPAEVDDFLKRSRLRSWSVSTGFMWLCIEAPQI